MNVLKHQSLEPLREKEFRRYITARFLYIMALRMVGTVVAYQLFQITKSSFSIGIVGLSEFIPVFSLALYAGHKIDQSDKRTLMLRGMFTYSLCVAALILVTSTWFTAKVQVSHREYFFYAIIFLTGIIRAFVGPTSSAILAQLVPRNMLHFASNISSSTFLTASIIGHASAGFFIAWFGVNNTFIIVLCYILIAVFTFSKITKKPVLVTKTDMDAWESVKEGLRYVVNNKTLLGAISLDLFAVLFGGAVALVPEFADRILNVGPIGFGWLNAAMDIGSMMVIISLTLFPLKQKQGKKLMFAVAGFGICIIVFGLSKLYWISFVAL